MAPWQSIARQLPTRSRQLGINTVRQAWQWGRSQPPALWLVILLGAGMAGVAIDWGLPDYYGWVPDELVPDCVIDAMNLGFRNGWHYKYPPVHFYLLSLVYGPILLFGHWQGIPVTDLNLYGTLYLMGRGVSLVMGLGCVGLVYGLAQTLFDRRTGLFAALAFVLNTVYVYYAKTLNLDIPMVFWLLIFLVFYLRILRRHRLRDYLAATTALTLSVCTKDPAYGFSVLAFPFVLVHYRFWRSQRGQPIRWGQVWRDQRVGYSLAWGLGLFLILRNALFNFAGFIEHFDNILYGSASIRPRYSEDLSGQLEMLWQTGVHLRVIFGWGLLATAIAGIVMVLWPLGRSLIAQFRTAPTRRERLSILGRSLTGEAWLPVWLGVPFVSYYLFYLVPIFYNPVRYLVPYVPLFALFAGKALADWSRPRQRWATPKRAIVVGVLLYSFFYAFSVNSLMLGDIRYEVEAWMRPEIPADAKLLGIGISKYLPRFQGWEPQTYGDPGTCCGQERHDCARSTLEDPTVDQIAQDQPDYIVISSAYDRRRYAPDSPQFAFFEQLEAEQLGYERVLRSRRNPRWNLLNRAEIDYRREDDMRVYSSFDKLDPEIQIFRRVTAS
jgi:hypothetical protein